MPGAFGARRELRHEQGRDAVLDALQRNYAAGGLTLEELDERLERTLLAESPRALAMALYNLPPIASEVRLSSLSVSRMRRRWRTVAAATAGGLALVASFTMGALWTDVHYTPPRGHCVVIDSSSGHIQHMRRNCP